MVTVRMTRHIGCTPEEFLEFVMDIERYQEVDRKIRPVHRWSREGNRTEFRSRPTLGGLPTPIPVVQHVDLTPGERVDISLASAPHNRVARATTDFHASFVCRRAGDGTEVTRTLTFTFPVAVRWLYEPLLRRRLPGEVAEELRAAKAYLEERGESRGG